MREPDRAVQQEADVVHAAGGERRPDRRVYGMQITEPSRYTNLGNDFEQLEDDVVRGRRKIGDMRQAVSDWKSKGGDKLRDWYKKVLDDNGPAAG